MKWFVYMGFLLLTLTGNGQSQANYDSLVQQLSNPMHDTVRINLLNQIATESIYAAPDLILQYADEALEISKKMVYLKGIAESYNNIGSYLRLKGLYADAMDYFFRSLELMEIIRYPEGIARSHNMFGILYYLLENDEQAISHFEKSLKIYEEIDDKKWIAGISNNMGMILERQGNFIDALNYYAKSLDISQQIDNKHWLSINFSNIGSLYLSMDHPLSLYYFRRSLDVRKQMNDTIGMAFSNYLMGKYFVHVQEFHTSIPYLKDCLEIANATGNLQLSKLATEQLSTAYAGFHDYLNAYSFHLLFKTLSDSLDLQSSTERITRLNFMHEYRKNKQLEDIAHEKSRINRLVIGAFLGLAFVILMLLYWKQRSKATQQRLNQHMIRVKNEALAETLKFKEKLLEENIHYLINKNELLTQVTEQLNQIKTRLKPENHSLINQLILDLQGGIQDESDEEFRVRFNQIHQDFYSNLILKFPELSTNETRLCAFLRLKMTTREISALTGQSVKSIEIARSRLRKKLNLSGQETNIVDCLEKI
ncbi:MAG: tetratricopeptide repeat protein [Bacteroidales bacterium]